MRQPAKRNHHVSDFTISHLVVLAGLMLTLLMFAAPAPAAERSNKSFNHLSTGFPLTGAHAQADCQTCHARGVFKGTPRQCEFCHAQGSRMASTAKPTNHVQTTQPCDQCHNNTVTWAGARFRHTDITPGNCMTCHNNNIASGKPANHMQTTAACDTCHRTTAWIPASFNHTNVTPGSCATCHNGSTATGKPTTHVQTTAACDTCHRTTAWLPATFSHTTVTPGSCATCHNGSTATGKPSNHVQTTASCDTCHRTTAWLPATFSHTTVTPGSCATCHNGSTATGKPSTHFVTTRSCDACHTTTSWTTVRYTHTSPAYSTHNTGVTCRGCHVGNNEVITWRFGAYSGSCAGCHAGDFKTDPHKKTETPTTTWYTVAELRNCAGSCHILNGTTGAITRSRSGEHRSTSGGF
jgi:hypothetical protein